jgi:hypothetical protein
MNWREHLRMRLREIQPASVHALDETARQFAVEALPDSTVQGDDTPPHPRALALGIDALVGLDAQHARHLISHTRLYVAPRILLVAQPDCPLDEAAFRALGFTLSGPDTAGEARIYFYDLDTYKNVPDWLNARFWAHPERWEP